MQTQILGLLTPLMALLFAATFAVFWKLGKMKRHVLGFALGYVAFAIGFLVTHFLPGDAFYTFHTTQLFYTIGVTFFLGSVCERVGQRLHFPTIATIYGISALVMALALNSTDNASTALVLVNIGYGAMYIVGLTTLMNAQRRHISDYAIIFLIAFSATDFFIRPSLTVMFETTIPAGEYQQSIYYSLIGLVLGVKSIVGAMILIGATIFELISALREDSKLDPLTSLHNRASFEQSMLTMLPRAQSERRPVSLVVADIDHFKQVNDIWGHQAGDQAISGFGELIGKMIRGCDTGGRIGGEEFCIAVWNCENLPAERLAERIRQSFAQMEHTGLNDDIRLTASFGVATAREGETYEGLFARADEALYQAKTGGRNRVENAEIQRKADVETAATPEVVEMKRAASDR
ncbi:GGDEF domain-containing protein [Erythrobacter crassostreae]|uniref:diguanylate cyclase n=1 Tax=Erythrobacter crassostreae TaxID=2828328 RepID=A0A9X1F3J0_9SPHN|nr:GGDEF domain-containing protein [Erythrobacter crassostrea]MBV7259602.1 diguanylate cyclase [Erythrobacter crassostrea]